MTKDDVEQAAALALGVGCGHVEEYKREFTVDYGCGDATLDELYDFGVMLGTEPDFDGVAVRAVEADGVLGYTGSPKLEVVVKRSRR